MTDHTHYIIACVPADDAPAAHKKMLKHETPAGEAFFGTEPKHIDAEGDKWVVVQTWLRPHIAGIVSQIADHFPSAQYAVTRERVEEPEPGDTVVARPDHGAFVVVQREPKPEILETLERIEVGDDID